MRALQSGGLETSVRTETRRRLTQAERRVLQVKETGLKEVQEWEEGASQVSLQWGGKIIQVGDREALGMARRWRRSGLGNNAALCSRAVFL